jgi:hypothetical protein
MVKYCTIILFDVSFDTLMWALRKNGYGKMQIAVGEIVWPSDGDRNANLLCARLFNQGFTSHVKSRIPMKFVLLIEAYMSSSFNEDAENIDLGKFERGFLHLMTYQNTS